MAWLAWSPASQSEMPNQNAIQNPEISPHHITDHSKKRTVDVENCLFTFAVYCLFIFVYFSCLFLPRYAVNLAV